MKPQGLLIAVLVGLLSAVQDVAADDAIHVVFEKGGYPVRLQRPLPNGASPVEEAIRRLVAGPTAQEVAAGVTTHIPVGTELIGLEVTDDEVVVDLSEEILGGLDEYMLRSVFDHFRMTLLDHPQIRSIRLTCRQNLLASYLPPAVSFGAAPAPEAQNEPVPQSTALAGRNITIGPSHGRFWNGSGWFWMRSDPCGFGEAVLEDTNSIRLMQFLHQYLTQDGAIVHVPRELDESTCCHGPTGLHWWKMAARYWLEHNGIPSWVWDSSTTDLSDDIRARPLYADYRGSDIYIAHHTNAGGGGLANGTETFRDTAMEHPAHEADSYTLALNIQSNIVSTIREMYDAGWADRGVKDSAGAFGEIRIPDRPACLVELGFHDNCSRDALYLTDDFFRSLTQWAIYKGVCDYFGVTPTWDKYSCEYVSDTIPATMAPGQSIGVSVTFRNRGVLWTEQRSFRLGAVGDSDPFTSGNRVPIDVTSVRPGVAHTFNFTLTAPTAPGVYTTDWRMVRDGVAWFGPTVTRDITVGTGPFPPFITQHPSAQNVVLGSTATFEVQASGTEPLSYQWQRDDIDLADDGRIVGATASSLQIFGVALADQGDYRCVVTNDYGSDSSNPATLTVQVDPVEFIVESRSGGLNFDRFATAGDWADSSGKSSAPGTTSGIGSVYTSSTFAGRSATYSYTAEFTGVYEVFATWVNSVNACPSVEHIVTHAGGSDTRFLNQLENGNAWNALGQYTLNAGITYSVTQRSDNSTGGGVLRADAVRWQLVSLPVEPPIITQQPLAADVCPGTVTMFAVRAAGSEPLSYQWQKNSDDLTNGGHYSGATTATLTVTDVDGGDVADYRCLVSNEGGLVASNTAALSLKELTSISQHPQSQSVDSGGNATFQVEATGDGAVSYQWQLDGSDVSDSGRIAGATSATLQITDVIEADAGLYRCVVSADCGSVTSGDALLTVIPPPFPDYDGDTDIDLDDYSHFQACLSGANIPPAAPACDDADLDRDNDVDDADLTIFQGCVSGANLPADPACND